jgi:hypothetical protein
MESRKRKRVPTANELSVFDKSRRRCALCFYLDGDLTEKHGQIAHLDKDPGNFAEDNLAFLCLRHHSLYDSKTSQHKNYTLAEVRKARKDLFLAIQQDRHLVSPTSPTVPQTAEIRSALITDPIPRCLRITTGESGLFCQPKARNIHGIERTLKLRIDNIHPAHAVTDIKVAVLGIEPQTEYSGPWVLETGFALAAGDHRFVPLARYGEASRAPYTTSVYERSETFFEILTEGVRPKPSKEGVHLVTIRATGIGSAPCDHQCKMWVDRPDGRLRVVSVDADAVTPAPLGSPLRIEFGADERYERISKHDGTGSIKKTIHVSIRNDSLEDIPDCKLLIVAATPAPNRGRALSSFPIFLGSNFDLHGGRSKFVAVISFAENPGSIGEFDRDNIYIAAAFGALSAGLTFMGDVPRAVQRCWMTRSLRSGQRPPRAAR